MKKIILSLLFVSSFAYTENLTLMSDGEGKQKISIVRTDCSHVDMVDSVNYVIMDTGNQVYFVSRLGKLYGVFPMNNTTIINLGKDK